MRKLKQGNDFSLEPGLIEAWYFKLADVIVLPAWLEYLDGGERQKAARFKFEKDRQEFIARRGLLRVLLGKYLQQTPGSIKLQTNIHGKPFISRNPITFNLSHSGEGICFTIARQNEIGIDLEQIKYIPDMFDIIERQFSTVEKQYFLQLEPLSRLNAFYFVWTQKEAWLKAQGLGLSIPLQSFSVNSNPSEPAKLMDDQQGKSTDWRLFSFKPEPDYYAAVCGKTEATTQVTLKRGFVSSDQDQNAILKWENLLGEEFI